MEPAIFGNDLKLPLKSLHHHCCCDVFPSQTVMEAALDIANSANKGGAASSSAAADGEIAISPCSETFAPLVAELPFLSRAFSYIDP